MGPEKPAAERRAEAAEHAEHTPYVAAGVSMAESTWPAILVGAILGIIFGASSLYLVLKVGMTVSASVPIAVLSITLFRVFTPIFGRNATILENNIVQTTGSAGESIAFGVGVTMPALLILGYDMELARVMLVACLGSLLGILMMIPLRRAFIVRQHGRLTYPEGTACADVLIVGEQGGASARNVFVGFGVAFVYAFLNVGCKLWTEVPTRMLGFFRGAAVSAEVAPALLGVGYIIGTRISCIMVAGGILAAWVLTPAIYFFGDGLSQPLFPGSKLIREMSVSEIRNAYVLYIGAGAVATGGIIAMFQAMPMIIASLRMGLSDLAARNNRTEAVRRADDGRAAAARLPRTDHDLSMKFVLLGVAGLILAISIAPALNMNPLGAALIVLFGFLFVTVSSRLVGEIGSSSNPISGMTVATLLLTCLIFLALGWTGEGHRLTALSVAAIVCIAASNAGATSQDLKTGFLVGGTPRAQQLSILVGALTSAIVIGFTLLLLNDMGTVYSRKDLPTAKVDAREMSGRAAIPGLARVEDTNEYGVLQATAGEYAGIPAGKYLVDDSGTIRYYVDPAINGRLKQRDDGTDAPKYEAPKAALMALIIDGILTQKMPWALVLLGVAIALVLELAGIPSLPFAVGVYLPLSSSMPIFIGGMVRWVVGKWMRRGATDSEMSPGVLLSSGYIAGGTIAAIVATAIAIYAPQIGFGPRVLHELAESPAMAMVPFALLALFLLLVGGERVLRSPSREARP
jgi:putative OPT family oligopeptide transporter